MYNMTGKVFLITGAAGGQGAYEVELLAGMGAGVILCDVMDDAGTQLADKIKSEGGDAAYYHLDVSNEEQWQHILDDVRINKGRLDGLVNNAGILNRTGTMQTKTQDWLRVMNVNLTGAFLGARSCARLIHESGGGSIVNIASVAAHVGHQDPAYSASKAGMIGLTKSQSVEFAKWKIRVNAVCPGIIVTGFNAGKPHLLPWKASTPMDRFGTIEEAANLVTFLLSDQSSFITGEDIAVDGGLLAGGLTNRIASDLNLNLTEY